jgi:hypothetical protein
MVSLHILLYQLRIRALVLEPWMHLPLARRSSYELGVAATIERGDTFVPTGLLGSNSSFEARDDPETLNCVFQIVRSSTDMYSLSFKQAGMTLMLRIASQPDHADESDEVGSNPQLSRVVERLPLQFQG